MRLIALVLLALVFVAPTSAGHPILPSVQNANPGVYVPVQTCCKICRKGKACGNSCISRSKTCRKPPGCACNAR